MNALLTPKGAELKPTVSIEDYIISRIEFYKGGYGLNVDAVYLGKEEWSLLRRHARHEGANVDIDRAKELGNMITMFGTRLIEVDIQNHLSFGFMDKVEKVYVCDGRTLRL